MDKDSDIHKTPSSFNCSLDVKKELTDSQFPLCRSAAHFCLSLRCPHVALTLLTLRRQAYHSGMLIIRTQVPPE